MGNTYTVTEITSYLKTLLAGQGELQNAAITGEISNFKRYSSGHCYFTLKDTGAQLKCVMFKWSALRLRFEPKNGDTVLAVGRIAVYERDGVYQLYVDMLQQQGMGDLMLAYERLKKRLESAGLFVPERKRQLPLNPKAIGIITSPSGAAVRDIISVARRRNPGIKMRLYPVQVQGEAAAGEIVRALQFFNKHMELADVLIVGRGGGSIEDLWAFNEEPVVRAVAASKLPVISAVGHETDFTLCDFAADKRAATPSQAAELAAADVQGWRQHVERLAQRCEGLFLGQLQQAEHDWQRQAGSWALRQPERILEGGEQRLDSACERLQRLMAAKLEKENHNLAVCAASLAGLNPLAVLARGYTVTTCEGRLVKSAADVRWGEELETVTAGGREKIISVVQDTEAFDY